MSIEKPNRITDIEEARAQAFAEKPFRDEAVEAKGRPEADREVLERVADTVGDRAGKEYRELKELLPTEVIRKLSHDLWDRLRADSNGQRAAARIPGYFGELVKVLRLHLKNPVKIPDRTDILALRPIDLRHLNLNYKYFNVLTWQNALYSVLGVGESVEDVFEAFRKLPEDQREKVAASVGEKVGNPIPTAETAAYVTVPTNIDGILLEVANHQSFITPVVTLKFTPEFLEKAMKQSNEGMEQ